MALSSGLCIRLRNNKPYLSPGECDPDYLVVRPYRGVFVSREPLTPARTYYGEEYIDFYTINRLNLSHYYIYLNRKIKMKKTHDINLFNGFLKAGEYEELETAFENYVSMYIKRCFTACIMSANLIGDIFSFIKIFRNLKNVDGIYVGEGISIYVKSPWRHSIIVEISSSPSASELFKQMSSELFKIAHGVHWVYFGRSAFGRSPLLDVFFPKNL